MSVTRAERMPTIETGRLILRPFAASDAPVSGAGVPASAHALPPG